VVGDGDGVTASTTIAAHGEESGSAAIAHPPTGITLAHPTTPTIPDTVATGAIAHPTTARPTLTGRPSTVRRRITPATQATAHPRIVPPAIARQQPSRSSPVNQAIDHPPDNLAHDHQAMASQELARQATVNQAHDHQATANPELDHRVTDNLARAHPEEIVPTRANQASSRFPTPGLRLNPVLNLNQSPKTAPPRNLAPETRAVAKVKADQPHNPDHPQATEASPEAMALQDHNSHRSQQLTAIFLTPKKDRHPRH
jgi:hypothetical protein